MAGMSLMVVAKNLGHSDTRMVEKFYGHLAPSYVADEIRGKAPRFGIAKSNIAPTVVAMTAPKGHRPRGKLSIDENRQLESTVFAIQSNLTSTWETMDALWQQLPLARPATRARILRCLAGKLQA